MLVDLDERLTLVIELDDYADKWVTRMSDVPTGRTKTEQRERVLDQPLDFGKYRRRTWSEVPAGYVECLKESRDWLTSKLAGMELERRKERP